MDALAMHDVAVLAGREALRIQEREAQYSELLLGPWAHDDGVLYRRLCPGPELVVVAVRHDALVPAQRRMLGAFRVRQYALCGLYDVSQVLDDAAEVDPSLEMLAPNAVHVLAGTPEGRLLAYMCMETAQYSPQGRWPSAQDRQDGQVGTERTGFTVPGERHGLEPMPASRRQPGRPTDRLVGGTDSLASMWSPERLQFPSEFELFGPTIFTSLPALRALTVMEICELTRMLRNQAIQSPQGVAATVGVVCAMCHLLVDPALHIKVALGCLDRDGRRMLAQLGMPVLYAPAAPVLPQQVAAAKASLASYWTDPANAPGRFWPFVVATEDLQRHAAHVDRLDNLLLLSAGELRRALVTVRKRGRKILPQALVPGTEDESESLAYWTANSEEPPEAGERRTS